MTSKREQEIRRVTAELKAQLEEIESVAEALITALAEDSAEVTGGENPG